MNKVNWDNVQDAQDFVRPTAGAYIATIVNFVDKEDQEYLRIEWDFAEGEYKGANQDTYDRAGFWPNVMIRSYKPNALPFFKAFKISLEASNRNYTFQEDRLGDMRGKVFGIILGEEEYKGNDGKIKTRLYVDGTRSGKAIQDGDFKIPEFKKLKGSAAPVSTDQFAELSDSESELPF